jgi:hypothetical protein
MSGGWWVRRLDEVPAVPREEPHDPSWHPLQHHFGLTAAGINAYRAEAAGDTLVEEHDERPAGHEELYYVTEGRARFVVDGEEQVVPAGAMVVVRDTAVTRAATAVDPGTTVLAVGGPPNPEFRSSWQPHYFEQVPRID